MGLVRMEGGELRFSREWFLDEVRDGFYVPAMMKRCWAAELAVLFAIDKVCKRHGLRWFADCGTLLGAVRHGGFIPWDDDLDICMLREDYDRFAALPPAEFPAEIRVRNVRCDRQYDDLLTGVENSQREEGITAELLDKYHGFPFVAGVDIYPFNYLAPDAAEAGRRKELTRRIAYLLTKIRDTDPGSEEQEAAFIGQFGAELSEIEKESGMRLDREMPLRHALFLMLDRIFARYGREDSDRLCYMSFKGDILYPLSDFLHPASLSFEGLEIPAMRHPEIFLRGFYGDYQDKKMPGSSHHYPFYAGSLARLLEGAAGSSPYSYVFSKEDLLNPGRAAYHVHAPQAVLPDFLRLCREAHMEAGQRLRRGTEADVAAARQILADCQDYALRVGGVLEERLKEGAGAVQAVSAYCEKLYMVYMGLAKPGTAAAFLAEDAMGGLSVLLEKIASCVKDAFPERREAVFLPWRAKHWHRMEGAWRRAQEEGMEVHVIPLPWQYRGHDGKLLPELQCERADFPAYVRAEDYRDYDFASRHPAQIVIQNPYDGCNPSSSVLPFFYAANLKQYTEDLLYIPYFETAEIDIEDPAQGKALANMPAYVAMPGVVHADHTLLQSEKIRQAYLALLTRMAGEESRAVWARKLVTVLYD